MNVFIQNVVTEKIGVLKNYFDQNDEHGMGFLYHLMELLRESGNNINFARYVYLLSRMEPQDMKIKKNGRLTGVFQERCTSGAGRNRIEKN